VVGVEELPPAAVTELCRLRGRANDVSEENRGEDPVLLLDYPFLDLLEEAADLVLHRLTVAERGNRIVPVDSRKPRGREPLDHVGSGQCDRALRQCAAKDEGRHADRRKNVPHVGVRIRSEVLAHVPRAHAQPDRARERDPIVPRLERRAGELQHLVPHVRLGPGPSGLLDVGQILLAAVEPRHVVGADEVDQDVAEDETQRPVGVRRREQHPERPGIACDRHDGAMDPDGVEDGPDVVHPILERRRVPDPVGQAGSALIEQDHPREATQALEPRTAVWLLPVQLEMLDEARDPDQRRLAVAEDLVGDVHVAAAGVARFCISMSAARF
jgi:hypothetical protein